jgi:Domain of unknown function (DUF1772)
MRTRAVLQFSSIIVVGICLVPAGAHLFELLSKISLSPPEYMTVQRIYAGWSLFGIPIILALFLTAVHTAMVHSNRTAFWLSLSALVCLGITQAVFWTFTYPMNVASNNWTVIPDSFEAARRQWEYSHAVNAVLTFVAFMALTLAVLSDKSLPPPTPNSRVA